MADNFNIDDILAEYAGGKNKSDAPSKPPEKKSAPAPKSQGISPTSILYSLDRKKEADKAAAEKKPAAPTAQRPANQPRPAAPSGERPRRPRPEGAAPNGERPRRPRPEGTAPNGERPRRPRPEGAAPNGERPRRPRPEGTAPSGERPRRPRPEGTAPNGEHPRRPRPEGTAPSGERPRRPRPEGTAPSGERPRRPRPEGAAPNGERPRRPRPDGARAGAAAAALPKQSKIVIRDGMTFKDKVKQYRFLFEELTKRDFKKKYKRTLLGIFWSVLSPFMNFLIYLFVFTFLFRRNIPHFSTYIMTGTLIYSFFVTSTNAGMVSMFANSGVISKIRVPKTIFLLSSNVACIFNFLLTLVVYFVFVAVDGLPFGPHMLLIIYPIVCMTVFNIGVGYILSTLFVFFRDIQYLYGIFTQLLMFVSAIFYTADSFPENLQIIFAINPIYRYITYVRQVIIDGIVPDLSSHLFCFGAAAIVFALGYFIHKKTEQKFVYYF